MYGDPCTRPVEHFFEVLRIGIVYVWCYSCRLYLNSHIFGTVVCFIAIQEGICLGNPWNPPLATPLRRSQYSPWGRSLAQDNSGVGRFILDWLDSLGWRRSFNDFIGSLHFGLNCGQSYLERWLLRKIVQKCLEILLLFDNLHILASGQLFEELRETFWKISSNLWKTLTAEWRIISSFRNRKSCVYYCDDLLSNNSSLRSSHIWFLY